MVVMTDVVIMIGIIGEVLVEVLHRAEVADLQLQDQEHRQSILCLQPSLQDPHQPITRVCILLQRTIRRHTVHPIFKSLIFQRVLVVVDSLDAIVPSAQRAQVSVHPPVVTL